MAKHRESTKRAGGGVNKGQEMRVESLDGRERELFNCLDLLCLFVNADTKYWFIVPCLQELIQYIQSILTNELFIVFMTES